jgi:RNase P/RNase MRP subunit p29
MSGKIIDETKSMFIIETKNGTKMIPKQHNKWKFAIDNLEFTADGNSLSKRPEDRIKVQI